MTDDEEIQLSLNVIRVASESDLEDALYMFNSLDDILTSPIIVLAELIIKSEEGVK